MTPSISNTFTQSSNRMQLLLPAPQLVLVFHPLSNHNQSIKTNQKNGINLTHINWFCCCDKTYWFHWVTKTKKSVTFQPLCWLEIRRYYIIIMQPQLSQRPRFSSPPPPLATNHSNPFMERIRLNWCLII